MSIVNPWVIKSKKAPKFFRVKNVYKKRIIELFQAIKLAKKIPITYNALICSPQIESFPVIRGHHPPD